MYEIQKDVDLAEKKLQEGREKISHHFKPCPLKNDEIAFESGIRITKIVNKFKCQLCGSTLNHVFIAQHSESFKKIVLGKTCVKLLLPENEWEKIIRNEKAIKNASKRVSLFIELNDFNLQEHLKNSAITEASLIKQIFVIEKAFPHIKKKN